VTGKTGSRVRISLSPQDERVQSEQGESVEFESRSLRRMSEFKANKAKASSSNLALSAFADGVSITFQLLLSTKLRNPTPHFPHFNNLYLIEVANRHRLTTSGTNQYFMNLNL